MSKKNLFRFSFLDNLNERASDENTAAVSNVHNKLMAAAKNRKSLGSAKTAKTAKTSKTPKRVKYTVSDDVAIIKVTKEVFGSYRAVGISTEKNWEPVRRKLERKNLLAHKHSTNSIMTHFLKVLLPQIGQMKGKKKEKKAISDSEISEEDTDVLPVVSPVGMGSQPAAGLQTEKEPSSKESSVPILDITYTPKSSPEGKQQEENVPLPSSQLAEKRKSEQRVAEKLAEELFDVRSEFGKFVQGLAVELVDIISDYAEVLSPVKNVANMTLQEKLSLLLESRDSSNPKIARAASFARRFVEFSIVEIKDAQDSTSPSHESSKDDVSDEVSD